MTDHSVNCGIDVFGGDLDRWMMLGEDAKNLIGETLPDRFHVSEVERDRKSSTFCQLS